MAKVKRRKLPTAPDAALIAACVTFAQYVAAFDAGFGADPTDSEFAEKLGRRFCSQINGRIRKIAAMSATTAEGVQAKARAVRTVVKNSGGSMEENEEKFFLSFASDVQRFMESIPGQKKAA
jgi:hypothetical protein